MSFYRKSIFAKLFLATSLLGAAAPVLLVSPAGAQAAPRQLGTVKAIDGATLTLTTTAGASVTVTVAADASVLQLPPGSTDLKTATPSALADVAVGDRVLVTGKSGDTATSLNAARVVLMKSGDIAAQQAAQQADWQRNGTGGLVRGVTGPVLTVAAGARVLKVDTTSTTIFRRYANDSVSFAEAKPGTLEQVQTGDQISVRGTKSGDGLEITAAEVVTGSFQNLSGAIASIDVNAQTVTLKDLISKKTETIHVTPNSDLRKLPAEAAAMFAPRPAGAGVGQAGAGSGRPAGSNASAGRGAGQAGGGQAGGGQAGGGAGRRAGMDLSRMLQRFPVVTLSDLKAGDAVMIVASQGRGDFLTAVTMLSGVEQLLSASGGNAQAITLSPWNLGVPEGGGGGSQ